MLSVKVIRCFQMVTVFLYDYRSWLCIGSLCIPSWYDAWFVPPKSQRYMTLVHYDINNMAYITKQLDLFFRGGCRSLYSDSFLRCKVVTIFLFTNLSWWMYFQCHHISYNVRMHLLCLVVAISADLFNFPYSTQGRQRGCAITGKLNLFAEQLFQANTQITVATHYCPFVKKVHWFRVDFSHK